MNSSFIREREREKKKNMGEDRRDRKRYGKKIPLYRFVLKEEDDGEREMKCKWKTEREKQTLETQSDSKKHEKKSIHYYMKKKKKIKT